MKRFLSLCLALCALTLSMSSCMNGKVEIPPTAGGSSIYQTATLQNQYLFYCVDMAFKLGVLKTEIANNPGVAISDIKVIVKGDNGSDKEIRLLDQLFSTTSFEVKEAPENSGIWSIKSKGNPYVDNTYGTLLINTNKQQIGDGGATWTITIPQKSEGSSNEPFVVNGGAMEFNDISIRCSSPNTWNINASGFGIYDIRTTNKVGMSSWTPYFSVRQSSGTQGYNDMLAAQFEMGGDASGNPTGFSSDSKFYYEIAPESPMRYKYCSTSKKHIVVKGFESVTAPTLSQYDPQNYPASKVTVRWDESEDCKVYWELTYNGNTATSRQ